MMRYDYPRDAEPLRRAGLSAAVEILVLYNSNLREAPMTISGIVVNILCRTCDIL